MTFWVYYLVLQVRVLTAEGLILEDSHAGIGTPEKQQ
jgi:hypothetical protein